MSEQDDQIFLKRFSLILVALMLFAIVIVFAAIGLDRQVADSENPTQAVATAERIEPVFDVFTGESAPAAAAADQASGAESTSSAGSEAVAAADIDGAQIYAEACQACHMSGAAGAPQLVAEQWGERLDQGMDTLVDHAINGIGVMPAKGGRMDLSDEQIRASVEYMVSQVR